MAEKNPFLPPRWFIRAAWQIHRKLYQFSGGRFGLRRPNDKTYGLMRVTTIGRRSGLERPVMLGYYEDGPNLVTMAMNGWGAPEPAWWLNLQAQPDVVAVLPERRNVWLPAGRLKAKNENDCGLVGPKSTVALMTTLRCVQPKPPLLCSNPARRRYRPRASPGELQSRHVPRRHQILEA